MTYESGRKTCVDLHTLNTEFVSAPADHWMTYESGRKTLCVPTHSEYRMCFCHFRSLDDWGDWLDFRQGQEIFSSSYSLYNNLKFLRTEIRAFYPEDLVQWVLVLFESKSSVYLKMWCFGSFHNHSWMPCYNFCRGVVHFCIHCLSQRTAAFVPNGNFLCWCSRGMKCGC
jgi:hypothetical protein